ncbi:helix-turn-helix domain-containing protein [Halomonas nitroreducens]|uniref:XRE family transcriptional regulator n=1 Tax=Halomonas nitroreducens TaxID=447425 RepID=A0A3S0KTF9_9GAMM|nr:helix-turn-helix transcriptional regulator [Halomonas nitroreducens]RTR06894.1 XRE family transcriptional regulator [Halomonas nitroreducens]
MDFTANLKLLCSYYPSTAQVCRRMGINRTQFNKYLTGAVQPSKANLRIICDFFGIEPFEIVLPHHQFRTQVMAERTDTATTDAVAPYFREMIQLHGQSSPSLERYIGWYYEYYYSLGFPGKVFQSLIEISSKAGGISYERYERLTTPNAHQGKITHCHYEGVAINLCDRIFLMDYEALTVNEITQTVLFPSYKSRITHLHGLKIGVSSKSHRDPACTRVLYEFLGDSIDFKARFRACGLYDPDELPPDTIAGIDNSQSRHAPLFTAIGE